MLCLSISTNALIAQLGSVTYIGQLDEKKLVIGGVRPPAAATTVTLARCHKILKLARGFD